jgi:hypothetical protein
VPYACQVCKELQGHAEITRNRAFAIPGPQAWSSASLIAALAADVMCDKAPGLAVEALMNPFNSPKYLGCARVGFDGPFINLYLGGGRVRRVGVAAEEYWKHRSQGTHACSLELWVSDQLTWLSAVPQTLARSI